MAKKKKFPYKFLTPEQLAEYKQKSKDELVLELRKMNEQLKASINSKKNDPYLKELNSEIAEYRKKNTTDEITQLTADLKYLKDLRDEKIADDISEQADLNAGYQDAINANKEHIGVLLSLL